VPIHAAAPSVTTTTARTVGCGVLEATGSGADALIGVDAYGAAGA
jgi:hypothetical protein